MKGKSVEGELLFATRKTHQLPRSRTELPVLPVKGIHKGLKKSMISGCAVQHLLNKVAICLRCQLVDADESVSVSVQAQLAWVERNATF